MFVDRPLVELVRLVPGGDPARLRAAVSDARNAWPAEPGPLEVARRVNDARAPRGSSRTRRPGRGSGGSCGRRHGPVDRVAQELVAEVVVALVDVVERVAGSMRRRAPRSAARARRAGRSMTPARTSGREAAPDHRAGPRRRCRASSDSRAEPGEHRVPDRVRDVRLADPPAVGPGVVVERRRAAPRCGAGSRSSARRPPSTTSRGAGSSPPRIRVVAIPGLLERSAAGGGPPRRGAG